MTAFRAVAAMAAMLAGPIAAWADEDVESPTEGLDTIVVTGTRTTDQLADIPNTTTVVSLDELLARSAANLPDALRQLPGVHVVQPSGQGGVAKFLIRGGDQELTLVLLDGVRVNDSNDSRGSAFDFSMININDIERIEVVRGPQSAVYGSDALSGVINIISKEAASDFGGSVTIEGGEDSFLRGALDLSGPIGDGGGFSLRAMTKDDGEPVTDTRFESDSLSGRLSLGQKDRWDLNLFANYTDSEGTAFPEDSGGADLAVIRETDSRSAESLRLGLTGEVSLSRQWTLKLLTTWFDHDASFLSPGVAPGVRDGVPPNGADSKLERANIAVNTALDVGEALTATFGVDYYDEEGTSDGFVEFFPGFNVPAGFAFDRHVTGAFAELLYAPERGVTVMASVRRDDSSNESAETTARLGILYNFNDGLTTLRGNWGEGFSLPGFFALASPLVGNPDLRPQQSESFDAGVSHRFGSSGVSATLTVFHNEFTDLIDFDSTQFRMVNRDRLDVDGIELQVDIAMSDSLSLRAQATHLDLDLVNSDAPVRQRPDWRGGLMLRWQPDRSWDIDASWLYSGKSFDSSIPTGDTWLDSYHRFDVSATYRQSDALQLFASVSNLFDEDYYEAVGFPAVGARARLGLRYLF